MKEKGQRIQADCSLKKDGLGMTIEAMFSGMEGMLQSKTVIGEPITVGDASIVPLLEISAGMASGAFGKEPKNGAGAMSAKMAPVALLVLQGDRLRLINVKNQDVIAKLIDLIPDAIDKITGKRISPDVVEKAKEIAGNLGVTITAEEVKEEEKHSDLS